MAINFPSALDSVQRTREIDSDGVVANNRMVANKSVELVANSTETVANTSRHGKYADVDKRRAYMREYMRLRRNNLNK